MSRTPTQRDWEKALRVLRSIYRVYSPTKSAAIKRGIVEAGMAVRAQVERKEKSSE